MVTKREKLQYAYVFLTDVLTLFVSVALVHLVAGQIWSRILPYDWTDWPSPLRSPFSTSIRMRTS